MRPRPALRLSNAPTPTDDRAARTGTTPTLRRMRTGTNAGDDCGMRSLGDGDGTCDGERSSSGASPIQTSSRLTGRLRTTIPPIFTRVWAPPGRARPAPFSPIGPSAHSGSAAVSTRSDRNPSPSFPAAAHRKMRGGEGNPLCFRRVETAVDPVPSLRSPGMTTEHVAIDPTNPNFEGMNHRPSGQEQGPRSRERGARQGASPGGARFRASARRSIMRREGASRPVSRVLYGGLIAHVAAIRLGRPLLDASRNQPGRLVRKRPGLSRARAAPIRSCSRWGLPCRSRCRVRGGLLPHLFTLTPSALRGRLRLSTDRRWTDDRDEAVCFLWHFP